MDVLPKISEIKNLKDLSKVIVLPLLCACYIFQTNFTVEIDNWFIFSFNETASFTIQVFQLLFIFICKTVGVAIACCFLYMAVVYADIYSKNILMPIIILLLLTFGFVGIFSLDKIPMLNQVKVIWFYSAFVVAFVLLGHQDTIENGT